MKKSLLLPVIISAVFLPFAAQAAGLVPAAACAFTRDLALGSAGADVACLQQALIQGGYAIPAGPTGYFGVQTRGAVAAWQGATGVSPTRGYFGPLSRRQWALIASQTSGAPASSTPSAAAPAATNTGGAVRFFCDFSSSPTDCGFNEQHALEPAVPGRATLVNVARSGTSALRLHTEPGDSHVHGSGTWERDDLSLGASAGYCNQGQEEWWADSVLFPDDYVFPPGPEAGVIFTFHHNANSGQSNLNLQTIPSVGLRLEMRGGKQINDGRRDYVFADPYGAEEGVTKNVWYDFVYHIKWSSGADGFLEAWLNGKKIASHSGPTLYEGIPCYLKLQNYHSPFGKPSSVIHDRVVRGTTAASVSLTPLEQ